MKIPMNVKTKTLKNVTKLISNVAIIDVFLEDGVAIMMMIVVSCNFFKIEIVTAVTIQNLNSGYYIKNLKFLFR